MFDASSLNLWSIFFGLVAWAAPMWYLSRRVKGHKQNAWAYLVSMGCCGASLWLQILYGNHLAELGDVAAWMDTADAVAKVAGFLLVTTLLLNGLVLLGDRGLQGEAGQ